ncbi:thiamine phosphate synthase [Sulfurimonas sp. MAG313]|nr:thiamine phosphate synthase [Sulfurimonas sp. MAG313]MDF1882040.1 thiamine phosphate synthase [Sulfurimonas sp. MAG313]
MKLYALCDQDTLNSRKLSLQDFVKYAKKHKAEIIQYRNKNASLEEIKENIIELRQLWDGFLIVNDKYELVNLCDGVHMGQEDLEEIDEDILLAVAKIREEIGQDKLLGISTHNEKEIKNANYMDLNYIGLGAFKQTSTKDVTNILGDTLDTLASFSKHKVAAIGGVKLSDNFVNVEYLVVGSGLYEG